MIQSSISRAVDYLRQRQLEHGEFRTFISPDRNLAGDCHFDSSPFTTAIVIYSLGFVESVEVDDLRRRALSFLHEERVDPGLWRYWSARTMKGIAPDVDDTSLISFVLGTCGEGDDLPAVNRDKLLSNRDRRGVFYTWFKEYSWRNDFDSVVNANALLYLGDGEDTRGASTYLKDLIRGGQESRSFWYYTTDLALHYAVSRALFHGFESFAEVGPLLAERVLARLRGDGSFGDELDTGLAVATLQNLVAAGCLEDAGAVIEPALSWLVERQQPEGGWPAIAYYQGPEPPAPRTRWFGSEDLTTAACLEALARHDAAA